MFKFITKLFDEQQKNLDRYQKVVDQINSLEPKIKKLTDAKLAAQTKKFQQQISKARNAANKDEESQKKAEADILDKILPEAFATVRETSRRVLSMRHFDVQLLAGIALHKGNVTEQKTGEGKTLTVTAPLYLNALLGKGSHLVTVNDYLAEVGIGWMGPVYHFLGLSTAVIVHDHAKLYNPDIDSADRGDERLEHFQDITRQEAYNADITYGTNNEFGFDYLRDNMVQQLNQMAQRPNNTHHFAIVDEADSILIDEARTPLIISAPDSEPTKKYSQYSHMVTSLVKEADYKVDEKARSATLTDLGVKRIEKKLGVKNLYEESFDTIHHVETALKAKTLYQRDKEYIVRDNQVVIVDTHTGRLMYGRRYSDGLHQAIEAKEGVAIQQESRTLATISIQNYFRLYHKLSGMTGTAVTEAEEFKKIYDTDVLAIPTNVPVVRKDTADTVFKTTRAKYSAIVQEIEKINKTGMPILVGTRSIDHNQIVADLLSRKKIPHQVLNAKNHEKEAFVIADAGKKGAITVATNIAGRGVDIVLGGAKPELKDFRKKTNSKSTSRAILKKYDLTLPPSLNPNNYKLASYAKALESWKQSHNEVVGAGGLHIIGTERHESRRIDNQLRGRSGRQGDPGSSQFYLSLEDEIMRIFGGEQISKLMDFLKIQEDQPIEHKMVSKSIESAQVKVEGFFFDQRKRLVEFDDVMNKHREIIYKRRRRLLEEGTEEQDDSLTPLKEQILGYIEEEINSSVSLRASDDFTSDEYDAIVKEFIKVIPFDDASQSRLRGTLSKLDTTQEIVANLSAIAHKTYAQREDAVGDEHMRLLEKFVVLSTIDEQWMEHLDEMAGLREGIWLRGDKNTVLAEYKKEAFSTFEGLIDSIESTIARRVFRVQASPRVSTSIPQGIERKDDIHESLAKEVKDATLPSSKTTSTKAGLGSFASALGQSGASQKKATPGSARAKIGRNDPCPCGAINPKTKKVYKYKKCGLIEATHHRG